MRTFLFVTVDVFTDQRFGGNPLAVFPDAQGLSDAEMQALAAEFNLSETTFVLPPQDPKNSARVRIFNRKAEMPFAGHPNVGTAWVLRGRDSTLRFEEIAGLVEVKIEGDMATIAAPQKLSLGAEMPVELLAGCVGLDVQDIVVAHHKPVVGSVGNGFVLAQVKPDALGRAAPDLGRFKQAWPHFPHLGPSRLPLYLYVLEGERVRTRMFSPLSGTIEDPATGSAATPLAALLLSLTQDQERRCEILQGVEMGRPSRLACRAWRAGDGIRATVGGGCVPVLEGQISL